MLTVLDLFSGIGGFSLGLERTGGFKTVAFCEIDPFCRKVLTKHWPDVLIHEDITTLRGEDVGPVDVIVGGFPCQDISTAGRGDGIEGSRSGLWSEFARLIGEVRPRYAIVENVSALLSRGLGRVLGDLSEIGYDAEWHCIPAAAVGAPHRRDRAWIVGYSGEPASGRYTRAILGTEAQECSQGELNGHRPDGFGPASSDGRTSNGANPIGLGCTGPREPVNASSPTAPRIGQAIGFEHDGVGNQWRVEPDVGRVAHGIPQRVDRLRSLGNAVVPQVVEVIGNAILEAA